MSDGNKANCPPETVASYFRMIDRYKEEIQKREDKIQQLMSMLQMEAGRTFQHEGQWYQICQRKKEGTMFFKKPKCEPKEWLGKKSQSPISGAAVASAESEGLADPHESANVDAGGGSGASDLSDEEPTTLYTADPDAGSPGSVVIE